MRIAVLASHGGSILQAVIDACAARQLDAEVVLVISNNSRSGAIRRAQAATIATVHLSSAGYPDPDALDQAMLTALEGSAADWVLLAGFMKKLGPRVLRGYRDRILNTHPALLPKFGGAGFFGRRVHEAVLAAGETETGATVHLVDEHYDSGPVLAQVRVPVSPGDDAAELEERVKVAERKLVVATLAELAQPRAAAG
ncbi:MAG: phosphoribosylglycinamide formyltransferase [Pseudomonadales bacterium]